ncbi:MAG TPA: MbnP family protein [Saprospiraceae bacterium]|nr:MbnP family protein [Saprospiraceae bacterium]
MKLIQYLVFSSLIALLVFGCKEDDKEGTLTLHFKAVYDGQPLQTFTTYPFDSPQQIQFTHLSFYVSDITLYAGNAEHNLRDIALVDLSFNSAGAADSGYTVVLENVPASSYDGIQFGIGVPPDENAKKPADFPSSSPLSLTGYYWLGWNSYIFMKTEGRLDTLGNGDFSTGYALHSGSDPLFSIMDGPVPLVIEDGKNTDLTILFNYNEILEGVDIKSNPQNHTPQDTALIVKIVNNLPSSIHLIP